MSFTAHERWGEFYAYERLRPMADLAAPRLSAAGRTAVDEVMDQCLAGAFDDDDRPARLHGDLWSGNVMWTSEGVALIDPAAHGGHRETDLAMLALFGCPFLGEAWRVINPCTRCRRAGARGRDCISCTRCWRTWCCSEAAMALRLRPPRRAR